MDQLRCLAVLPHRGGDRLLGSEPLLLLLPLVVVALLLLPRPCCGIRLPHRRRGRGSSYRYPEAVEAGRGSSYSYHTARGLPQLLHTAYKGCLAASDRLQSLAHGVSQTIRIAEKEKRDADADAHADADADRFGETGSGTRRRRDEDRRG